MKKILMSVVALVMIATPVMFLTACGGRNDDSTPQTVTISFVTGYAGVTAPSAITRTVGTAYGDLPTISRSNHNFNGWWTGATNGSQVTSTTVVTNTANHNLYARWVAHTVSTVPQSFTATAGNANVTLAWTAPANNGGSAVTGFQVQVGNATWVNAQSATGHTFTGLTNGTEYTFRVRAVNAIGNSPYATATATPYAGGVTLTAPSVPQSFTATAGVNQVTLAWTAPANTGGAVVSFEIRRQPAGGSWINWTTATSGHVVTGLTANVLHSFEVRARNIIGYSSAVSATATPTAPAGSEPTGLDGQWVISQSSRNMFTSIFEWSAEQYIASEIENLKRNIAHRFGTPDMTVAENLNNIKEWFAQDGRWHNRHIRDLAPIVAEWTGTVDALWAELATELAQDFQVHSSQVSWLEQEAEQTVMQLIQELEWLNNHEPLTLQSVQDDFEQALDWVWLGQHIDEQILINIVNGWVGNLDNLWVALEQELFNQFMAREAISFVESRLQSIVWGVVNMFGLDMSVAYDLDYIQEWFDESDWADWIPQSIFTLVENWTGTPQALWTAVNTTWLPYELAYMTEMNAILDMITFEIAGNEIVIVVDLIELGMPDDFTIPSLDELIAMGAYEMFGIEDPITLDEFIDMFLAMLYDEMGMEVEITDEQIQMLVDLYTFVENSIYNGYVELRLPFTVTDGRITFDSLPAFDDVLEILVVMLPIIFMTSEGEAGARPPQPQMNGNYPQDPPSDEIVSMSWFVIATAVMPLVLLHDEILVITATNDTIAIGVVLDANELMEIFNTIDTMVYDVMGVSLNELLSEMMEEEITITTAFIMELLGELYDLAQGTPMAEMLTLTANSLTANVLSFSRA